MVGQEYKIVYQTVYEEKQQTAYRIEYETVYDEKPVTTYKPVWETATREVRYTVAKPVVETSEREETYTVQKPVYETQYARQQLHPHPLRAGDLRARGDATRSIGRSTKPPSATRATR